MITGPIKINNSANTAKEILLLPLQEIGFCHALLHFCLIGCISYLAFCWGKYCLFKDIKGKTFGKEQVEDEFKQMLGKQVIILSVVCLVYEDQVVSASYIIAKQIMNILFFIYLLSEMKYQVQQINLDFHKLSWHTGAR